MDPQLIDRIYESSFVPELWRGVLGELANIASARVGFLFVSNGVIHHWAASLDIGYQVAKPLVESGWIARSERFARYLGSRHAGFVTDSSLYTLDEMKNDPFYRDILYPRGLGWGAGTFVPLPTGDVVGFSLDRDFDRGPVEARAIEQLDELRPHLGRSAFMSARLQLERAQAASETLAMIGLATLVLDEKGKVLAANALIEAMPDYVQWRAHDRLTLKDRSADLLLRRAIATIDLSGGAGVRSFPLRGVEDRPTMVAHVIPVRLSARDIFVRCAAVMVLTPVTLPQAPPVELVQSLFDLTPAEARVARSLAAGKTVDDIASDGGTSRNTVRTQVRSVLEKTGCSRQTDVVGLLTGILSARLAAPA